MIDTSHVISHDARIVALVLVTDRFDGQLTRALRIGEQNPSFAGSERFVIEVPSYVERHVSLNDATSDDDRFLGINRLLVELERFNLWSN